MCCFIVGLYCDVKIEEEGTFFQKALEDLDMLVFEELDSGLSYFLMFGRMGKAYDFIEFLLMVYILQCKDYQDNIHYEHVINVIQDCDMNFDDVYNPPYWYSFDDL